MQPCIATGYPHVRYGTSVYCSLLHALGSSSIPQTPLCCKLQRLLTRSSSLLALMIALCREEFHSLKTVFSQALRDLMFPHCCSTVVSELKTPTSYTDRTSERRQYAIALPAQPHPRGLQLSHVTFETNSSRWNHMIHLEKNGCPSSQSQEEVKSEGQANSTRPWRAPSISATLSFDLEASFGYHL